MIHVLPALLFGLLPLVSAQGCPFTDVQRRDALGDEPSLTTLADSFGQCPNISDAGGRGTRSRDWWPCQLQLDVLRQFSPEQNPRGSSFDYTAAFNKLDCKWYLVDHFIGLQLIAT
jgi:catalase-peroxidase